VPEKEVDPGVAIIRVEDYYPFGVRIASNEYISGRGSAVDQLFAGKELQDVLGLDWYDFGARMLDPTIGRWLTLDPYAEKNPSVTPYGFAFDNPVRYVDLDGREAVAATPPSGPRTREGQWVKTLALLSGISFGPAFDFDALARTGMSLSAMMDVIQQTQEAHDAVDKYNSAIDSFSSSSAGFGDAVWFWCPGCASNARSAWGIKSGDADPYAYTVGSITGIIASLFLQPSSVIAPPKPTLNEAVLRSEDMGAYVIRYKNGYWYVGKGGVDRASVSALRYETLDNPVVEMDFYPELTSDEAFRVEYQLMEELGGPKSTNPSPSNKTFNKVTSPGKNKSSSHVDDC
jgi:RHS repeat-associated protein